jgi:hypothetical protein
LQDHLPVTLLDGAGGAYFSFLLFPFSFQALDDLLEQWVQRSEYPPERSREGNAYPKRDTVDVGQAEMHRGF